MTRKLSWLPGTRDWGTDGIEFRENFDSSRDTLLIIQLVQHLLG